MQHKTSFQIKNNKVIPNLIWNLPLKSFMDKQQTTKVGDPGQKPSGMTLCDSGFTLIELLVVVLIIGILAAVALPQYQKAVTKSRLSALKPMVSSLSQAAEIYYLANNTYPSSLDQIDLDFATPVSTKKSEGSYEAAVYSWGFCYLEYDSDANVSCYDSRSDIGYLHFFNHITQRAGVHPGQDNCVAKVGNDTANKVCQQETGLINPTRTWSDIFDFSVGKINNYLY